MDATAPPIDPDTLYCHLGTGTSPLVVDVRRTAAFADAPAMLPGAIRRDPESVPLWSAELPFDRKVVAYCVHGHEVSHGVAAALRKRGIDASYLAGGIEGWRSRGFATRRRRDEEQIPSCWITRERPKVDRIACPWLIRRFIDPEATFIYVPADQVIAKAAELRATPYDGQGVEFTHEGERCSFDTLLRIYEIKDRALDRLATIVRGADTSRHDLAGPCAGQFAISLGLSRNFPNDHEMLEQGMVIYDALFVWCRDLQDESHNWPSRTQGAQERRA